MDDALPCLVVLLAIPCLVAAMVAVAWWIFRPLDEAGKRLDRPTQFTIVDFFCLFFVIQLPMAFIHFGDYRQGIEVRGMVWTLDGFVWVACGSLWLLSVRTLSRAGVTNQWHRAILLALVLPVAIVGAIAVPILSIMSVGVVLAGLIGEPAARDWILAPAIDVGLIAAVYAAGRFTRRVVALPPAEPPKEAADAEEHPEDPFDRGAENRP